MSVKESVGQDDLIMTTPDDTKNLCEQLNLSTLLVQEIASKNFKCMHVASLYI